MGQVDKYKFRVPDCNSHDVINNSRFAKVNHIVEFITRTFFYRWLQNIMNKLVEFGFVEFPAGRRRQRAAAPRSRRCRSWRLRAAVSSRCGCGRWGWRQRR